MGFFDSLFGGLFGRGNSSGGGFSAGNRGYDKLLWWAERRVGPLEEGVTESEIDKYISSINRKLSEDGSALTKNAISALREYLKRKFGQ